MKNSSYLRIELLFQYFNLIYIKKAFINLDDNTLIDYLFIIMGVSATSWIFSSSL